MTLHSLFVWCAFRLLAHQWTSELEKLKPEIENKASVKYTSFRPERERDSIVTASTLPIYHEVSLHFYLPPVTHSDSLLVHHYGEGRPDSKLLKDPCDINHWSPPLTAQVDQCRLLWREWRPTREGGTFHWSTIDNACLRSISTIRKAALLCILHNIYAVKHYLYFNRE